MSRTQLPSIFPWTEPSKNRREIVKNELPKTCKRKKDEDKIQSSSDTVSWLIESPTQSTSNTEEEIQRSHIELEKMKREQTEKEEIQRLQAEQIKNERFQMQRELDSLKKEVNKLK